MDVGSQLERFGVPGILFGIGGGGFLDGFVPRHILAGHGTASHIDDYPTTTVAGLQANTPAESLFRAETGFASLLEFHLAREEAAHPALWNWVFVAISALLGFVGHGTFRNIGLGRVAHGAIDV